MNVSFSAAVKFGGWLCGCVIRNWSIVPSTGIVALPRQPDFLWSAHPKYLM